jgi:hypothetical protein
MADQLCMTFSRRVALATLLLPLAAGCIDDDDRCGPNMMYDAVTSTCMCEPSSFAANGGCTPCAADEVVIGGTSCGCAPGQAKDASNVCATVAGLGDSCSDTTPCSDATYSYCAPSTAGSIAGTCTSSCTVDEDCGAAFTCATWEAHPYCRAFSGFGMSCAAQSDCAGYDAQACDTVQSHVCVIAGCSLVNDDCARGTTCCDLSAFGAGTICMGACP